MLTRFSTDFDKEFERRLTNRQKMQVLEVIEMFLDDPFQPNLRNHGLTGKWKRYRSISAGGDLRLHFQMIDDETAFFVAVGTHNQLYK